MGWVREVQPTPIPMKPIPAVGFTHTHTTNPWFSVTLWDTHKPIQVIRFFHFDMDSSCFFVFLFCFLCYISRIVHCNYVV